MSDNKIDVLAFGAHPDDIEASCGGLLLNLVKRGYLTGAVDVTNGGLGTNGTPEIRREEAVEGSKILGNSFRENLQIPEGEIADSVENRKRIVSLIRKHKPTMVLVPYWEDRHPDHVATSRLVSASIFYTGLRKLEVDGLEAHRPKYVLYYALHQEFQPSFIVDITEVYEQKREALLAHKSQFFVDGAEAVKSYINTGSFLEYWDARARRYGYMIGAAYGEPYVIPNPPGVDDPYLLKMKDF